jgi:hypothetical protein
MGGMFIQPLPGADGVPQISFHPQSYKSYNNPFWVKRNLGGKRERERGINALIVDT